MPLISPFTGLLFDPARVGPLESVTAPPYDMISREHHERFLARSPYNVVRLILGDGGPEDQPGDKYTGALSALLWLREEHALVPTTGPAWFPYEMRFVFGGEARRIRGLICQVALEPWGGSIRPHERTLRAPVLDRLSLLRAVQANLSPVYAVYEGPSRPLEGLLDSVTSRSPDREAADEAGVTHRLWVLPDHADVRGWLRDRPLLIADGHHRYTGALAYQREMRRRRGAGPWDHLMMLLVDAAAEDPPVLPIHRILLDGPVEAAGTHVRDLGEILAMVDDEDLRYGMLTWEDEQLVHHVARLRGDPPTVCRLHERVLRHARLRYTPDPVAAAEAVRSREAPAALFLPPTRVERIQAVIQRGERLPEKSTHFWPKPRTGMVIRPFLSNPPPP